MMKLTERIAADRITITRCDPADEPAGYRGEVPKDWYLITLNIPAGDGGVERDIELPEYGVGVGADEPTVADVMDTFLIGVRSVNSNPTYQAWLDDWDRSPEDASEEDYVLQGEYREWQSIAGMFQLFLGWDRLEAYMYDTESDV